jgi:pyruvate, orthophosphate dikinase
MSRRDRIALDRLEAFGLPVPPSALLDLDSGDDHLRKIASTALAAWERTDPLFVALARDSQLPTGPASFLGATAESLAWLENHGNPALARAIRERDFSGGEAPELVEQIVRVARSISTSTVTLRPMLLGCCADGDGSGLIRSGASGFFVPDSCGTVRQDDPAARPLSDLTDRPWWSGLADAVRVLEAHCQGAVEVEFVVHRGQLYLLGAVSTALVTPHEFARMLSPAASGSSLSAVVGHGLGVSSGIASGHATFDPVRAVERGERGEPVVLIRTETRPEDLNALLATAAVVTTRGGRTSHAAVVARTIGRPCVVGLVDARIDACQRTLTVGGLTIEDGQLVTVDGLRGLLALGAQHEAARPTAGQPLDPAVARLLDSVDRYRRLEVWANADTAADADTARRSGATGIGLCRTEHMFLGERQRLLAQILLRPNDPTSREALEQLHRLQRADFVELLAAMDGLPVTVRLLDPPRHEFLPDLVELSVQVALAGAQGDVDPVARTRLRAVERLAEHNPMLGVRGIRLGLLLPWLYQMQISALVEATLARLRAGANPRPLLLIPMVATAEEMRPIRALAEHLVGEARPLADGELTLPVGAMIETPRAALLAGELAAVSDFFCLGTNDLTQLTWGLSRDDTESEVLGPYQDLGLIDASPFQRLDRGGIGQLVQLAVDAARPAGLKVGVCGEHAADADSITAFHGWGLDYISCAPPELTLARYAAGHAGATAGADGGVDDAT